MPINFSITNPRGTLRKVGRVAHTGRGDSVDYHVDTSGLPESYADLVAANPYLDYEYTPGVWDSIGNLFGFRTREDKYREEMQQASREFETQLLSMAREEKYNSPLEQAARQREAGINPDLNGVGQDSAAEFAEPETRPVPPDGGEALQFVGNIFSAMTSLLGFAQGWTNLRGSIIDNDLKDASFVGELFNIGRGAFLNQLSPDQINDFYSGQYGDGSSSEGEDGNYFVQAIMKGIDSGLFHSQRSARRFFSAMNSAGRSILGRKEAYTAARDAEQARGDLSRTKGSSFWSDDDKELEDILGEFGDAVYKLTIQQQKNAYSAGEIERRSNEAALQNGLPELEAEAQAQTLTATREVTQTQNEVNSVLRGLIHNLHEKAKQGSKWANIALVLIGVAPSMLQNVAQ